LARGLPVRFKSARLVLVARDGSVLAGMLRRIGIADVCCVSEMAAARMLCDAGKVDACLVLLPRVVPDDKPDWDASTEAPGRGRIPSLLMAEAATRYIRHAAANAGYCAVRPYAASPRVLYRCIAALLQSGRQAVSVISEASRKRHWRVRRLGAGARDGETAIWGKPKLQ
jgi:hypothetical protein